MVKILMNEIQCKIKNLISEKLSIFKIEIIDDSYKHINHQKDTSGGHFRLFIVSNNFKGLTLIKRHKLIYEILQNMIKTKIHALSMKLLDIDEYNKN